jgi:hypothetical protein
LPIVEENMARMAVIMNGHSFGKALMKRDSALL